MRFLFNAPGYKPAYSVGGPIISVSALAEGLVRRGHSVFVAAGNRNLDGVLDVDSSRVYEIEGVKVRYFDTYRPWLQELPIPYLKKSSHFGFNKSLEQWLSENAWNFDVFHTHLAFLSSNPIFSLWAKNAGKLYLYHQRGNLDPVRLAFRPLKKRLYLAFREMAVLRRADMLLALTEYEAQSYRALGLRNRIEILPNGLDVEEYCVEVPAEAAEGKVASLIRELEGKEVLLFLSRIHPTKGPELFVDAFLELAGRRPEAVAVLAGPDEFGYSKLLSKKVAAAGFTERFFCPGAVSGKGKIALMQAAKVFVLPTISEGFSMVLLEALACGCPVVTTAGAHFDEIQMRDAGKIAASSSAGIARAIMELLERNENLKAVGLNGRKLVQEKYSWNLIVDRYQELCREAARQPAANKHL